MTTLDETMEEIGGIFDCDPKQLKLTRAAVARGFHMTRLEERRRWEARQARKKAERGEREYRKRRAALIEKVKS